jgi:hypothetical protein
MKIKICFAVTGIILAFCQPGFAAMKSSNYAITTSVMSSGGTPMGSAGFQNNATLGQPSPLTPVSSPGFELFAGFWNTLAKKNCIWDFEPDGDVDGLDLREFRLGFGPEGYNETDLDSFREEFGRSDCSN